MQISNKSIEGIIKKIPIAGVRSLEEYYTKEEMVALFSITPENLSSQCNGSNKVFTTDKDIKSILIIHYNGGVLTEGVEVTKTGAKEITLGFAPASGDDLRLKYI